MSADNHDMNYSAETYVVAGGRPAHEHDAPVNPPIVLTSTYRGVDAVNIEHDRVYARFSNPTWEGMEEVVAKLENASQPGLLFGRRAGDSEAAGRCPQALRQIAVGKFV